MVRTAAELVGDEPVSTVSPVLKGHTGPAIGKEVSLRSGEEASGGVVIEPDGIALTLSGPDGDDAGSVGIAVEVVIGVILRQIGEAAHAKGLGIRQGQAGVFLQNSVHIRRGQLRQVHLRVHALVEGIYHLLPLLRADGAGQPGAVVKQLVHVDVLGLFVKGGEELITDLRGAVIEKFIVEVGQLLPGQGLSRFRGLSGAGEGGGADHRCQSQHQEQGRRHGLAVFGDAGHTVLQPPFVRCHGGGGQQRAAGTSFHRDEGQQGLAVGNTFSVAQLFQGTLVAGQLAVGAGDDGRRPHQRVKPIHRQTHAPQKAPQGVQVAGMGALMGNDVPQPLRGGDSGRCQIDGGSEQSEQAGGGETGVYQIDGILAVFNAVRTSYFTEFSPEPQVGHQEKQCRHSNADQPDTPEQLRSCHPACVESGGFPALVHHHDLRRGDGHCVAGLKLGISLAFLRQVHLSGGQDVYCPLFHLLGDGLPHRLRRRQHVVLHSRQADGYQQPHQHQAPQGVLHPAGDGFAEYLPQRQQNQDQHGGRDQNIFHFPSPPAFSKMADSSAMSASVSAWLSTRLLTISPRLPP